MMSWQILTETIQAAGEEARAASLDAHGHLVPIQEAYDFLLSVWYDTEDARYDVMPTTWIPRGFALAYKGKK